MLITCDFDVSQEVWNIPSCSWASCRRIELLAIISILLLSEHNIEGHAKKDYDRLWPIVMGHDRIFDAEKKTR